MNKEAFAAAHQRKLEFLRKRIKEGVSKTYPGKPKKRSIDAWSRQRKIGFRYVFQDKNLEEIGKSYGITRERARQINKGFLPKIWHTASPKLRKEYPLKKLPLAKPLTQKSREKVSASARRTHLKIKKSVQEEKITDPTKIANDLSLLNKQTNDAGRVLKDSDTIVATNNLRYKDLVAIVMKEDDDEKLQEFLDSLPTDSLKRFLDRDPSHETLTTVLVIARKKGFYTPTKRVRFIAKKIKEAKIPIRKILYLDKNGKLLRSSYIVFTKYVERIVEVLRNDPNRQRFRENNAHPGFLSYLLFPSEK